MFIFLQSSVSRPFSMMIFLYYLNFMTFTILMTPKSLMRLIYTFQSVMSNYFLDISTWMSSGHFRFRRSKVWVWSPYASQSSACEMAGWVTKAKPGITLNISLLLTPFQSTYQIRLLHPRNIPEIHLLFSLCYHWNAGHHVLTWINSFYQSSYHQFSWFWNSLTKNHNSLNLITWFHHLKKPLVRKKWARDIRTVHRK